MLFISYRKDFWSNIRPAEHDAIRDVSLTGPGEQDVSEDEFNATIRNKKLLLLIHGYRNSREDVIGGYAMLEEQLLLKNLVGDGPRAYSHVIGITWPGGMFRVAYALAKLRANAIGDSVFARLKKIVAEAKAVDIMTHSLGARVALKALQNAASDRPLVRHLILTAPAVDDESIQQGEKFFAATQACEDVYVMFSKNDGVLKRAYPIPIVGDGGKALGYSGPKKTEEIGDNVHLTDCSAGIVDHSCYRKRLELYSYISKVLAGQQVPAELPTNEGFVAGVTEC